MRTIDTPEPIEIEQEIRNQRGKGKYQRTRAYLTKRKIVLNLTAGPRTYTQIYQQTKIQKQTLVKNLREFTKKRLVHKHKLARGILEHQRGQPDYYILNFSHKKVSEFLNGPYPDFVQETFKKATKLKKLNSEYKKYLPILYEMIDYYKWRNTFGERPSSPSIIDSHSSMDRDPKYYKMLNKAYSDELIKTDLNQLKNIKEKNFAIEIDLKKAKIKYEADSNVACIKIGSLLTETFGLTIWDALIMYMDCLGISDNEYLRIWNLYQSKYPDEFVF